MQYQVNLTQDQVSYIAEMLTKIKTKRTQQISASERPSQGAKLELLAISDLISKFETAKPQTVELPVLEQLG